MHNAFLLNDVTHFQFSYSPWGVRTRIGDETNFYLPGEGIYGPFYRTYTGHEDLWMFGLLNANARLYSPYLGRFVSPDPLLNSEGSAWDYNPYVYARNNPYKYIDRNGEIWWWAIFAALGAGFNILQNKDNIHSVWDGLFYGAVGAGAGAFGGWIGPSVASGLGFQVTSAISGAITGAVAGLVSSGTEGLLNAAYSGNFSSFSLTNCLMQTAFSAVLGGIMGGLDAVHDGRSFWHGYEKNTVVVDKGHPVVESKGRNNCVGASLQSMTNGEVTQEQVRSDYNKRAGRITDPNTEGMHDLDCYQHTAEKVGRHAEKGTPNNPQYIFDGMKAGDDFGITYWVSGVDELGESVSGWHNVLMTRASQTTLFKPNGTMIMRKPKLWVMDPAHGGSIHRIYKKQLETVIRVH
ncbi:MAG: RHS repeat-associated core domain-containing protein [Bacteroidaceae bacterium]|nr:RHS repeat-associated core domain-containing protein [Bacteroidaceae bacterium]